MFHFCLFTVRLYDLGVQFCESDYHLPKVVTPTVKKKQTTKKKTPKLRAIKDRKSRATAGTICIATFFFQKV